MTGSWLSGPSAALPKGQQHEQAYSGELLGLPQHGPGSLVSTARRVLALSLDWFLSLAIAASLVGENPLESSRLSGYTLIIWFVVGVVTVSLFSFTPGQFIAGVRVIRVDEPARVGIVRALARQLLIVFVVPATVTDVDGRGMHDRATGTAIVSAR